MTAVVLQTLPVYMVTLVGTVSDYYLAGAGSSLWFWLTSRILATAGAVVTWKELPNKQTVDNVTPDSCMLSVGSFLFEPELLAIVCANFDN